MRKKKRKWKGKEKNKTKTKFNTMHCDTTRGRESRAVCPWNENSPRAEKMTTIWNNQTRKIIKGQCCWLMKHSLKMKRLKRVSGLKRKKNTSNRKQDFSRFEYRERYLLIGPVHCRCGGYESWIFQVSHNCRVFSVRLVQ